MTEARNKVGLTFQEWLNTANFGSPPHRQVHNCPYTWRAWRAGEDPTDWAGALHDGVRPGEKISWGGADYYVKEVNEEAVLAYRKRRVFSLPLDALERHLSGIGS